jgi:streptogramin lyase
MNALMSMRALVRRRLLPVTLALIVGAACAGGANAATIDEFPLGATPTGIVYGGDGALYVTTTAPSILRVSADGAVTARYPLTANGSPTPSLPIFAGGALWFSLTRTDASNYVTTSLARRAADGAITEFPIRTPSATVTSLAAGPDGNVWFTQSGTREAVGRITPAGLVTEFTGAKSTPTSIAADNSGRLWITEAYGRIAQVSTTGTLTESPTVTSLWKVASSPSTPTLWFAGRQGLCCYAQPWVDFAVWLEPGSTPAQVGAGFLGTARVQDIAVGADGNAWETDNAGGPRLGRVSTSGRTRTFTEGLAGGGDLRSITAGPGDTVWFTTASGRIGRVRLDRPAVATGDPSDIGETGAGVSATGTALGAVSRLRFEYGETTGYGATTRWQLLGDGDAAIIRIARLDGLLPATTYHYRAAIDSPFGTTYGEDRTFTTVALPPPPPVPPADIDADGYAAAVDCNDHSATVYPGAEEVAGDRIDQDCNGADEPLPRFFPHIDAYFTSKAKQWSRFTTLTVDDVPAGATIQLRCSGGGCRFKSWRTTLRRQTGKLDLLVHLRRSKLDRGAALELRLTLSGYLGTVVRWKVGPPPKPTVRCLAPGAKRDTKC